MLSHSARAARASFAGIAFAHLSGGPMPAPARRLARLALAVAVWLAPTTLGAQSVTGSLSGTVVDQTRQVLPGAAVTLTNELTADSRATTTNGVGVFVFSAVQPGSYTLKIELAG